MNDSPRRTQARDPLRHDPAVLQRRRIEAGINLPDLAGRADISKGYLSELENGNRSPSAAVLGRLAGALGCTVRDLLAKQAVR